jgi:hypothetical protein
MTFSLTPIKLVSELKIQNLMKWAQVDVVEADVLPLRRYFCELDHPHESVDICASTK